MSALTQIIQVSQYDAHAKLRAAARPAPGMAYHRGSTLVAQRTYSPYGEVTANGDVAQPIQWSSEFNDTELGLVYYNYRHYNPMDGRWTGRDIIFNTNPYCYVNNAPVYYFDICGAIAPIPILVGVFLSLGVAYGIDSYLKYSRHRAGHVRIYAPDCFGYDENISAFMEKVNKLRDLYTGKVLYDFTVFERSEFQKVIKIIENRSDEKCIRKLVLAAHGKASPKDESDFEASMEFGIESLTETNISDMFEGIIFCSPCHIELRVCHIEKSQQLKNSLIEKYPCTITMYDTYVKP
ncbi:MAG: RHS repeat-associated core domain-containing protein [Akkermansia sp.]|nr:RHS repeat-associated core domain-containing protein [Akkermansia sp.]